MQSGGRRCGNHDFIGFGAILLVSTNPTFKDATGAIIGGTNMVAIHLASAVGGNLFLGFISAVAFATILAVVSGLALAGASAVAHDLYACVIKKGKAKEEDEMKVTKRTTLALGVLAFLSVAMVLFMVWEILTR